MGIDWTSGPRGLILRWRDEDGKWSKEHYIDLGLTGETELWRHMHILGKFRVRQWEIIHVDRIPTTVVYLEMDVHEEDV